GSGLDHPNIIAALDGSLRTGAQWLAGARAKVEESLAGGDSGGVLGIADAIPYAAIRIWEAHITRDVEGARGWQQRILGANELVTAKYGVAGLKVAMDLNGYYGGPPRLPLTVLTPDQRREIEAAFDGIRG